MSLRDIIERYDLAPQKKLGQNFILDSNITDKIARSAGSIAGRVVLEIGPGPGGLTRSILAQKPKQLIAVEKDPRCLQALQEIRDEALLLMEADALQCPLSRFVQPEEKIKIIANLPYNVGTELLLQWLSQLEYVEDITIMLQKEVAERIVAKPGEGAYGRLSILCHWLCDAHIAFHLPPSVFFPPPKVYSSVIHLKPLATPRYSAPRKTLERVVAMAFSQRRKMLRGSLKALTPDIENLLESVGISPQARPEDISAEAFCRLAVKAEAL